MPEIRGNAVDENCDRRAEPFADLGAVVANQWVFGTRFSRLLKLVVHNAPAGARVAFRCTGRSCPTRRTRRVTVRSVLTRVTLHRPFRRRAPAARHAAEGDDHRGADDRPHLHLRRQARRGAREHGHLPRARASGGAGRAEAARSCVACARGCCSLPRQRTPGTFSIAGSTLVYTGDRDVDQIAGFDTGTHYPLHALRRRRRSARDARASSARTTGPSTARRPGSRLVVLALGGGDDVAAVSANVTVPVRFDGGDGNDGLFGGGGTDEFLGGAGNDNVVSRDGKGETVDCGAGQDTAISDDADTRTSCEEIEGDADGDGVRRPADCDDTNPGIRPGATDVPDDRIDQDCSGADATNLDVDGDGTPRPQDCDDSNPAIRPGAREIVGNTVDENCDTRADAFLGLGGVLRNAWAAAGRAHRQHAAHRTRLPARHPDRAALPRARAARSAASSAGSRAAARSSSAATSRAARSAAEPGSRSASRARPGSAACCASRSERPGTPSVEFLCLPPGGRVRDC